MPYKDPEVGKAWHRAEYQNNHDYYLARQRRRRARYKELIRAAKKRPCADCGIEYPYYVMEFDHLGDKITEVSKSSNFSSEKKLLEEIAKCQVVCANCHAQRTYDRLKFASVVEPADTADLNPAVLGRESSILS